MLKDLSKELDKATEAASAPGAGESPQASPLKPVPVPATGKSARSMRPQACNTVTRALSAVKSSTPSRIAEMMNPPHSGVLEPADGGDGELVFGMLIQLIISPARRSRVPPAYLERDPCCPDRERALRTFVASSFASRLVRKSR